MPLGEYRRKRKFDETSEPSRSGRRAGRTRIFVVQHHRASHDHHDFRLEFNGVLKSWAVPRHVSEVVGEKRLAVQVEDHPLAYATFEGRIPEGNYGAGVVKIWDHGTWEPEGSARAGLRDGKLDFTLHGGRLRGRWTLVRTARQSGTKPQWLLIRRHDLPHA